MLSVASVVPWCKLGQAYLGWAFLPAFGLDCSTFLLKHDSSCFLCTAPSLSLSTWPSPLWMWGPCQGQSAGDSFPVLCL